MWDREETRGESPYTDLLKVLTRDNRLRSRRNFDAYSRSLFRVVSTPTIIVTMKVEALGNPIRLIDRNQALSMRDSLLSIIGKGRRRLGMHAPGEVRIYGRGQQYCLFENGLLSYTNISEDKAERAYKVIDDVVDKVVIDNLRIFRTTAVDGLEKKGFLLRPSRLAVYDGLIRGHVAEFDCTVCVASGDGRVI